jgi:membrane associated rhomboid family serine protease
MSSSTPPSTGRVCYRHADRPAGVSCQRCERPICPACMNSAAVGFQCPECFNAGVKSVPKTRTTLGGVARVNDQVISLGLIAVNVLVWIGVMAGGDRVWSELVMWGPAVESQPWRLITSAFTHERFFHIFSNLFMLYQLGPVLERMLGRLRFIILYFGSALGGSLAVWLLAPDQPTLGASGAVLGLVGAFLVISRSMGQDVTWILGYLAITAFISFYFPNISWQGHLGGVVTGAAIGAVYVFQARRRQRR